MTSTILELAQVTKTYGTTVAVHDVSVRVRPGEFVTFLGPSGCGKTTSLRLVAGFIEPTSGRISINGRAVSDPTTNVQVPPEDRNLGMVFQSYAVWPHMSVFDNVAYPLRVRRESRRDINHAVDRALDLVKMRELSRRHPHELSGGQQQRVAVARALVTTPDVLLLDEPLSNLDAKLREQMRIEIKELQNRTGVTIIFVTHDQLEAMVMSDRIVVMDKGEIQQIGTPEEIYRTPRNQFVADFIGAANFIDVEYAAGEARVLSGLGAIAVADRGAPGARGVLMARPEQIGISLAPPGTPASGTEGAERGLRGIVQNRLFVGDAILYLVDVFGSTIRVKTSPDVSIDPGEAVNLELREIYALPSTTTENKGNR